VRGVECYTADKIARADHDRQKKQSTIEFYNSISLESQMLLDDIESKAWNYTSIQSNKALRKSIIRYLSRLERLAVGVSSDVYDFDILNLMSGRNLSKKYIQLQNYIEEARVAKKAPMLYMVFELLIKRIDEYRKIHPKQIVDKKTRVKQP